jgi:hypothetical protein
VLYTGIPWEFLPRELGFGSGMTCWRRLRILGFALGEHHDAELAHGALAIAVAVRGGHVPGVIMHTDQGSGGLIQPVVATPRSGGARMGRPRGWAAAATGRPPLRSPGRPPVSRREHRQRFWAAIGRGLPREDAAVEAGVPPVVGTRWFREAGGKPPVTPAPLPGRFLSFDERGEIAILGARGCGSARSPGVPAGHRRRSPASCAGTPQPAAACWSTGPRRRSGTLTARSGVS